MIKLKYLIKFLFLLILLHSTNKSNAQREAENWCFGFNAGLNFKNDTPSFFLSSIGSGYTCATISDVNGNLLMYSNMQSIWNKNHSIMTNGTGLLSRTSAQSIIVPMPGNNTLYYIFTVHDLTYGIRFSIIDITLQNGLGEVISKNNLLYPKSTDAITVIKHSDNTSLWIITHDLGTNAYMSFRLTSAGISYTPVYSYTGLITNTCHGYLKISPDSKKLASITYDPNSTISYIDLLDFNANTGVLSNALSITSISLAGSVEFSPDGSKLYISSCIMPSEIYQFDLNAGSDSAIINSGKVIGYLQGIVNGNTITPDIGDIQVAIDGKIYVGEHGRDHISVINDPNNADTACHFKFHKISLGGASCRYGFPSFIQSYFFMPFFNADGTCYEDTTFFSLSDSSHIDSLVWCFDDSLSGSRDTSTSWAPYHTFTDTGIYDVSLIVYHNGLSDTTIRDIRISPYPIANFTINDNVQCLSGNNFVFTDSSSISAGSYTLVWDFGDSTFAYNDTVSHSYLSKGNFNVKLSVLSDYGCENIKTKNVNIYFPSTDFTINDRTQCLNENLFYFVADTINNPDSTSYSWNLGDSTTSNLKSTNHSYLNTDTFLVSLIVKYDSHCIDTGTKNIYINPSPQANFSVNNPIQCFNENNFIFQNLTGFPNLLGLNYAWNFGDSTFSTDSNINHIYQKADTFEIELIATSNQGCTDTATKNVIVLESPKAKININDTAQCFNENSFTFFNPSDTLNPAGLKTWHFGDGNTSNSDTAQH
ncbi:MAG: PKD domain-containing protein, partial [Bacteroidota bacterium]|nr:PKD domain-containing protein [Bacteroidota bacterium]